MNELGLSLERWANFYLIASSAAATLVGLLFVIVTLAADRRLEDEDAKIHLYLTPTAVYFGSVLAAAALLTFPNHTRLTATLCVGLVGVLGLVYSASLLTGRGRKNSYYEQLDLILYVGLPFAAYGFLVWGAVLLLHDPQRGLTFVAAGMLSLLVVAIRNAWAMAIGVVSTRPGRQ